MRVSLFVGDDDAWSSQARASDTDVLKPPARRRQSCGQKERKRERQINQAGPAPIPQRA